MEINLSFRELSYQQAVLLVIDIQEKLLKTMNKKVFNEKLWQIELLVKMFNTWNRPVIITEQYPQGLGSTFPAIKNWFTDFKAIAKTSFSCLASKEFTTQLDSIEKGWAILTGMETHICVLQTALDLKAQGWNVAVAADAVQSSSKEKWKFGLEQMLQEGIHISLSETILFQCIKDSKDQSFKKLNSLLKQ